MRLLIPHRRKLPSEPWLNAMAAIAAGMFIGCWILGPLLTDNSDTSSQASKSEALSYEAMIARPDPFPYRAATPTFDPIGQTHYAEAARQSALAEIGSGRAAEAWSELREREGRNRSRWHYRTPDRHAVY